MSSLPSPPLVDAAWLLANIDDPNLVVIDSTNHLAIPDDGPYTVTSGEEDYRAAHIPGALFADLLGDFADVDSDFQWTAPDSAKFAESAGRLGIGPGATVIVYGQENPFWATRFWWHLKLEGFDNAFVLDGGLPAWKAAGGETTNAVSVPTPRTFVGERRPELLTSTSELEALLDDENTIVVNALDEATYRGEVTTYARNGHIPGSINFSVARLIDPTTGTLRPIADLRAELEEAGLLDPARKVVAYCGGGIAATGIAHALAQAGRDDVAVYDGSLTEWVADPSRPLVTGSSPR